MKNIIKVNDLMQENYQYELVAPQGKQFNPRFEPELTPKEMLSLGVFGGKYMTDCKDEFPREWFESAKLNDKFHDPKLNFFGVNASQSLRVWRQKGWINPIDPRGWFQWYCRYYQGRRSVDDERQIGRWRAMKRHIGQIKKYCLLGDINCRKKQRQALLHWAYDARVL